MYPWLWFWAPQFHFPFSGSVAQRIDPDTSWFFAGIRPEAGNGDVEKQIFDVASYGRQLGLITEVLLANTSKGTVSPAQAAKAQAQLEEVYAEVESVKARNREKLSRSAVAVLEKLQAADPDQFAEVLARFSKPAPLVALDAPRKR
jgi:hypothetical protein